MKGGERMIPLAKPHLGDEELTEVGKVIKSRNISSSVSEYLPLFEEELAAYHGYDYCVGCSNGLGSLMLALRANKVKGSMFVQNITYVATANAIHYVEAKVCPIPTDINLKHGTIDVYGFGHPTVITPLYGLPVDYSDLEDEKSIILQDCAQYPTKQLDRVDMATSFHAAKYMTSGGEGGAYFTDSKDRADIARHLRSYATVSRYYHNEFGYNFRMTAMQAAFGLAQLRKLPAMIQDRRKIARRYYEELKNIVRCSTKSDWLYVIQLRDHKQLNNVKKSLEAYNIQYAPCYTPLTQMPMYIDPPMQVPDWELYLALPLYPDLDRSDQESVIRAVKYGVDKEYGVKEEDR